MAQLSQWTRYPTPTTGGKRYFWHLMAADGADGYRHSLASIVWNRGDLAYHVACRGKLLGMVANIPAGRRLVHRELAQSASA